MRRTAHIMGMPITIEIRDDKVSLWVFDEVFDYFKSIDQKFSPFLQNSEVSRINRREIEQKDYSSLMHEVLRIAEKTKQETHGYFDVWRDNTFDPSGIVKGWSIYQASVFLESKGWKHYYINAGGDIQTKGCSKKNNKWRVGIKNPFNPQKVVKVVLISGEGIATSGTYEKGEHIYNPFLDTHQKDIVSISVIGPDVLEADRLATAAFAMGKEGIYFIEQVPHVEGYMIDKNGIATYTTGFPKYFQ